MFHNELLLQTRHDSQGVASTHSLDSTMSCHYTVVMFGNGLLLLNHVAIAELLFPDNAIFVANVIEQL